MSPPERLPPDDPREWLNRARSTWCVRVVATQEPVTEQDHRRAVNVAAAVVRWAEEQL